MKSQLLISTLFINKNTIFNQNKIVKLYNNLNKT